MFYTLRFCARGFLALTKKSLFLEVLLAPDDFKLLSPGREGRGEGYGGLMTGKP